MLADDTIDGGAGNDTAIYSGAQTDYTITNNANGTLTVTHDSSGDADTLSNVEDLVSLQLQTRLQLLLLVLYHCKIYHPLTQHLKSQSMVEVL